MHILDKKQWKSVQESYKKSRLKRKGTLFSPPRSVEMQQTVERRALLSGDVTSFSLRFPMKAKQKLNPLGEWFPTHPSTSVVALHLMWTAF
ncbi:hypothetical protein TNCV_2474971 [Trichonephila clavipes]|nr:hypothetical protein TNCV_2474971 [Trichonephila clavipes]